MKINLREIGWGGRDATDLAQDMGQWKALVNTVINLNFGNFFSSSTTGGFSRRAHLQYNTRCCTKRASQLNEMQGHLRVDKITRFQNRLAQQQFIKTFNLTIRHCSEF
jgi:hypothetical protein